MKGKEFITMMRQDIETHKQKEVLSNIVDAMEVVVNQNPFAEIDSEGKTPKKCYEAMKSYAYQLKSDNIYCFSPTAALKFISEYLGIAHSDSSGGADSSGGGNIIDLENFL